jgi:hypothetical protein
MSNWFYVSAALYVLGAQLYFHFGMLVFEGLEKEGKLPTEEGLTEDESETINLVVNALLAVIWPFVVLSYLVRSALGVEGK